jgi:hypothetical protein
MILAVSSNHATQIRKFREAGGSEKIFKMNMPDVNRKPAPRGVSAVWPRPAGLVPEANSLTRLSTR